ncbi:L-type lectin-domain containing receptor kinase SIT2-like [Curcuma longa]|uniref:L-type lectin-domain containing receptor kinase SIT2-like n=1 Tax=Curcuma longa TaxID=136217 RepID=UPI003D9DD277
MCHSTFLSRLLLLLLLLLLLHSAAGDGDDFTFNGFRGANLTLDEATPSTRRRFNSGLPSTAPSSPSPPLPPSTILKDRYIGGNGLALVISRTDNFSGALGSQYLGLFNPNNDGNSTNHVFAVELDTIYNPDVQDIDDNHVGIDINSVASNVSVSTGYFSDDTGVFQNLSLVGEQVMQAWVD